MALPAILATVVPTIIDGIRKHFERGQELAQAKHEARVAEARAEAEQAGRLDELSIAQRGWKDDYLLIITTSPVVLLFFSPILGVSSIAEVQEAVRAGFLALEDTPEYYWYALALIYIDTFGFRQMLRGAFQAWLYKRMGVPSNE
jgi:hypothetical protein